MGKAIVVLYPDSIGNISHFIAPSVSYLVRHAFQSKILPYVLCEIIINLRVSRHRLLHSSNTEITSSISHFIPLTKGGETDWIPAGVLKGALRNEPFCAVSVPGASTACIYPSKHRKRSRYRGGSGRPDESYPSGHQLRPRLHFHSR